MTEIERMGLHMYTSIFTGVPVADTLQHAVELTKVVIPLVREIATGAPEANLLFAFMYLLYLSDTAEADDDGNVSVMPKAHDFLEVAGALLVD